VSSVKLSNSLSLTDPDEIALSSAMRGIVVDNDMPVLNKLIENFKHLNPNRIYRLTSHDDVLKDFCRKQIDLQQVWSVKFLKGMYPSIAIPTLDGSYITIYDLLMGATLFSEFTLQKSASPFRLALMNASCDWGFYDALVMRCQSKLTLIKKMGLPTDTLQRSQHEKVFRAIKQDVKRLAMNYWGIGFLRAGSILNQLALLLVEQIELCMEPETDINQFLETQAQSFQEQAVTNILCSSMLGQDSFSTLLANEVTQGKGALSIWHDASAFSNGASAELELQTWLTPESYAHAKLQARTILSVLLKNKNTIDQ
jgi:hypothetical protein